jgi:phage gp36-like protein
MVRLSHAIRNKYIIIVNFCCYIQIYFKWKISHSHAIREAAYYTVKTFQQIETPDDGRVWPKHVVEKEGDNKRVTLWTDVQCMNDENINQNFVKEGNW